MTLAGQGYAAPIQPALDQASRVRFSVDSEARYDNNVYLSETDEVDDIILSIRPGISFETSNRGALRGQAGIRNAFTRAVDKTSDDESLLSADASAEYQAARLRASASFAYDQSNQNSRDLVVAGRRQVFRTDSLNAEAEVEHQLTGKSAAGTGFRFRDTRYPDGVLIDNRSWEVPVSYFYSVSPKTDVFASISYRRTTADGSAARTRSLYYSLGARGEFFSKVTGRFSAGYRTLKPSSGGSEEILAFDGALDLAVGPKTKLTLSTSRDFTTSSQGESLTTGVYQLSLANQTSLVWQNTAAIAFSTFDYGNAVFADNVILRPGRVDNYLELSVASNYAWNSWLQTGVTLAFRRNDSNYGSLEFDSFLAGVSIGVQF